MYAEVNGNTVVTWPYNYDTLCKKNPYTIFPSNLTLLELYKDTEANNSGNSLVFVVEKPEPQYDQSLQYLVKNSQPVIENSNWVLNWTIENMSTDQQAEALKNKAASVRNQRNNLLSESDWTQMSDNPLSNKTVWATYRQELRDISKQTGFPWSVTWPEKPQ